MPGAAVEPQSVPALVRVTSQVAISWHRGRRYLSDCQHPNIADKVSAHRGYFIVRRFSGRMNKTLYMLFKQMAAYITFFQP